MKKKKRKFRKKSLKKKSRRKFRKKSLKKKSRKKSIKKKNKRILKKRKKNKTRKKKAKKRLRHPRKTRTVILGLLKANERLKSVFRFKFNLDQSLQNFFQTNGIYRQQIALDHHSYRNIYWNGANHSVLLCFKNI